MRARLISVGVLVVNDPTTWRYLLEVAAADPAEAAAVTAAAAKAKATKVVARAAAKAAAKAGELGAVSEDKASDPDVAVAGSEIAQDLEFLAKHAMYRSVRMQLVRS